MPAAYISYIQYIFSQPLGLGFSDLFSSFAMHSSRIQQYTGPIEQLLACPSGEEGQVLQEHQDLVDTGLLAVMKV